MSLKQAHSYNLVGTYSSPATLTAAVTGNTKTVLIQGLANQMLAVAYTPKAAQTNRYCIITIETSNDYGSGGPADASFKPYTAVIVTSAPANEVDLLPSVASIVGAGYGTPLVLPTNSTSATSTGGTTYEATYSLSQVARWMRVSIAESGSSNFGTAHVEIAIQE